MDDIKLKYIGQGLYLGEGSKTKRNSLNFVNGDPRLCRIMVDWFVRIYKVPITKIAVDITAHSPFDDLKLKKFWSEYLDIPITQIKGVHTYKKSGTRGKRRENGFCRLNVYDTALAKKVFIELGLMSEKDFIDRRRTLPLVALGARDAL